METKELPVLFNVGDQELIKKVTKNYRAPTYFVPYGTEIRIEGAEDYRYLTDDNQDE